MDMFYVYEWYVVETGEIIYVGKGSRNRYKNKKKNKMLNRIIEKEKCDVRIVAYYESEAEAFEAERKRINILKSQGQAICNKCVFSTGGVAYIWTEERRKEKSINNPMKNPNQRERMSKQNPMKNKEIAKRVNSQKRKPLYIGNKEYSYAEEASKEYNVSKSTIYSWVKNGITRFGEKCGYIEKQEPIIVIEPKKETFSHSIIYDGKEFLSTKDAAEYAGIKSTSTITRWCKRGFSSTGVPCRFKDDTNDYIYVKPNKAHTNRSFVLEGVHYFSIKEACEKLNISNYVFKKHYSSRCKYDNQHPSCGKSDNSTAEGSTTNG